jgi:predicted RNA-binding Zn-ribbon protein involved in translation (DUF1610 family)
MSSQKKSPAEKGAPARRTFVCRQCGYKAPVGRGGGWSTCPDCGGNQVEIRNVRAPAAG